MKSKTLLAICDCRVACTRSSIAKRSEALIASYIARVAKCGDGPD